MWDAADYGLPVQRHTLAWTEHQLHFVRGVRYWRSGTAREAAPPRIALAPNQDGRLQALVIGGNGQSYSTYQTAANGNWTNWAALGGTSNLPAGASIALAPNQDGRLQALVIGGNGQSYSTYQTAANGNWTNWAALGGPID